MCDCPHTWIEQGITGRHAWYVSKELGQEFVTCQRKVWKLQVRLFNCTLQLWKHKSRFEGPKSRSRSLYPIRLASLSWRLMGMSWGERREMIVVVVHWDWAGGQLNCWFFLEHRSFCFLYKLGGVLLFKCSKKRTYTTYNYVLLVKSHLRLHAADYVCQQGPDLSRVCLPENQNIFDDPSRSGDVCWNIFTCNNHAKNLHALDLFAGKQAVANAFSLGLSISSCHQDII